MNMPHSPYRRALVESQEEALDDRQDWEKLRDAVNAHLENKLYLEKLQLLGLPEADLNAAKVSLERTRSDLACLIEDTFCVSAERLAKALAS